MKTKKIVIDPITRIELAIYHGSSKILQANHYNRQITKSKKYFLLVLFLLVSFKMTAYGFDESFCENLDRADKEAESAWNQFENPKMSMNILWNSRIVEFYIDVSNSHSCFSPDKQVAILERYAKYAELSNDYYSKDWAIGAYKRILVLEPTSAKTHLELSRLYTVKGRLDRDLNITELAREHMRMYVKLAKSNGITDIEKKQVNQLKEDLGIKTTTKTFGTDLDKNSQEIPINAYRSYYFNTSNPSIALVTKITDRIAVNLTPNDMKIDYKSFGAYWIGYKDFSKDQMMTIRPQETWGKSKIYIDGYQVLTSEGNIARPLDYFFKKGRHKIEVEFINNWHTAEFSVNIAPKKEILSKDGLKEKLRKILSPESELYFYNIYESTRDDQSVDIFLMDNKKPSVLVLLSHDPIRWNIKKPKKHIIEAIIDIGSDGRSEVVGDLPDESRILSVSRQGWVDPVDRYTAKCDRLYLSPSSEDVVETVGRLQEVMNHKEITSINQAYSASIFTNPKILTIQEVSDMKDGYERLKVSKNECMEAEKHVLESKLIKPSEKTYNEGSGDIRKGQKAYLMNCKSCHGNGTKGARLATQAQWNAAFVEHGKQMKDIHQKTDANSYFQSPLFEEHYRDLREFLYEYASDVERGE